MQKNRLAILLEAVIQMTWTTLQMGAADRTLTKILEESAIVSMKQEIGAQGGILQGTRSHH